MFPVACHRNAPNIAPLHPARFKFELNENTYNCSARIRWEIPVNQKNKSTGAHPDSSGMLLVASAGGDQVRYGMHVVGVF